MPCAAPRSPGSASLCQWRGICRGHPDPSAAKRFCASAASLQNLKAPPPEIVIPAKERSDASRDPFRQRTKLSALFQAESVRNGSRISLRDSGMTNRRAEFLARIRYCAYSANSTQQKSPPGSLRAGLSNHVGQSRRMILRVLDVGERAVSLLGPRVHHIVRTGDVALFVVADFADGRGPWA